MAVTDIDFEKHAIDAIVGILRTSILQISVDENNVTFQPGGQPYPMSPDWHIVVDEMGMRNIGGTPEDYGSNLIERYRFSVTINKRMGELPSEKHGDHWIAFDPDGTPAKSSLARVTRDIIRILHGSWSLNLALNLLIELGTDLEYTATRPLFLEDVEATRMVGPDWSGQMHNERDNASGWIVRKLNFVGLDRIVPFDDME